MVVEWLMSVFADLLDWAMANTPQYVEPDWVGQLAGAASSIFEAANSMGVWFPAQLVLTVLSAVLAFWLVALVVKVARIIISHVTGGGGSAA